MARRYYSRRTRVVRPKKKWASNIKQLVGETTGTVSVLPKTQSASTHYVITETLVENTTQNAAPTPVIVKCGNFKLKGDLRLYLSTQELTTHFASCVVYVMYLPEGATASAQLIQAHPEWIMAWTPVDVNLGAIAYNAPQAQNVEKFNVSSRLKRNLNSGDRVVMLLDLIFTPDPNNTGANAVSISYQPAIGVQYWTCAN